MKRTNLNTSANILTVVILVITIAFSIVLYIDNVNTQQNIENKILEINAVYDKIMNEENQYTQSQLSEMNEIYLQYYNSVDQKFDNTINKILAFIGCIFSVTTIVNTIIALRMPKAYEDNLKEIDLRIAQLDSKVKDARFSAQLSQAMTNESLFDKIEAISKHIESSDKDSADLFFARGSLFDSYGDFESAEKDYRQAKKCGLSEYGYYNAMGVLYSNKAANETQEAKKKRNYKISESNYLQAIKIAKKEKADNLLSDVYCNLACLYQDFSHFEKALQYFDLAISVNEENKNAYFDRAISYEERGSDYYEKALIDYNKCINIDPYYKTARLYRAELCIKMYELKNDSIYIEIAKKDANEINKETNRYARLQEKLKHVDVSNNGLDALVAKIDEKIADLSVEEAKNYPLDSQEYENNISEAKKSYHSALAYFRSMYAKTNKTDYWDDINRLQNKIKQLDTEQEPIHV